MVVQALQFSKIVHRNKDYTNFIKFHLCRL